MKGRKSLIAVFLTGLTTFMPPQAVFASGYPVIDLTAAMNAMTQIFNMYDQINATIESVENGYKQIEQAINAVKSFKLDELNLEDWSSEGGIQGAWQNIGRSRTRLQQAGAYASDQVAKIESLQHRLNAEVISFNGQNYTITDLCGRGGPEKTVFGLAANISQYAIDSYGDAAKAYEKGLSYAERQEIMEKYGVSPRVYYIEQVAEGMGRGAIEEALGKGNNEFKKAMAESAEQDLQEINNYIEMAENGESDAVHFQALEFQMNKAYEQRNNLVLGLGQLTSIIAHQKVTEDMQKELENEKERKRKKDELFETKRTGLNYKQYGF